METIKTYFSQLKNDLLGKKGNTIYELQKDIRIAKFLIYAFSLAICILAVFKHYNGTLEEDKWLVVSIYLFFIFFLVQHLYYTSRDLKDMLKIVKRNENDN